MATKKSNAPWKKWVGRGAVVVGLLLVVWFAVEGGEYGTRALFDQKSRRTRLANEVAQLKHEIDSLQKDLNAAKNDNATIERIAREEYGMVKGTKELLYWTGGGRTRDDSLSASNTSPGSTSR